MRKLKKPYTSDYPELMVLNYLDGGRPGTSQLLVQFPDHIDKRLLIIDDGDLRDPGVWWNRLTGRIHD